MMVKETNAREMLCALRMQYDSTAQMAKALGYSRSTVANWMSSDTRLISHKAINDIKTALRGYHETPK